MEEETRLVEERGPSERINFGNRDLRIQITPPLLLHVTATYYYLFGLQVVSRPYSSTSKAINQ